MNNIVFNEDHSRIEIAALLTPSTVKGVREAVPVTNGIRNRKRGRISTDKTWGPKVSRSNV